MAPRADHDACEGGIMTDAWQIRRCDNCGALESDPNVELIVERRSDQVDRVIHVVGGGLRRCGALVAVDEVKP
jgi:hypothetical protein